jgi:hypothetical protein
MVWDIDIYQTSLVVLTIAGVYTITGEAALTTEIYNYSNTLCLVESLSVAFSLSLKITRQGK